MSEAVSTYDPRELFYFFRSILGLYEPTQGGKPIHARLSEDFENTIFSPIVKNVGDLIKHTVITDIASFSEILAKPVSLRIDTQTKNTIHNTWSDFKSEIRSTNRFHLQNNQLINLDKLKSFFNHESFISEIKAGKILYRGRISESSGFPKDQMNNPPSKMARAGRANPKGISYLYLADQAPTALYEIRTTMHDYATIAEFQSSKNLKILNLRSPKYDPMFWAELEALEDYLIYVPFIKTLQNELSMPIRGKDKEIDYLPTQYLSEYIKSIGFDGIEYQSSLYKEGYNIAVFDPSKFTCIGTSIYEITGLDLHYIKTN